MIFASDWPECIAVVALSLTSAFSYLNASYGTAVIAAMCAGLIAGIQFTKWAMRQR